MPEISRFYLTQSRYLDGYRVAVEFNDGFRGAIDFQAFLQNDHRPVMRALLDSALFRTVHLDLDTLCWDNGVDFAPERLREMCGDTP
jgi:hypothetical protein